MNYQRSYTPIRPIKSFQDLEVYQKLLAISVTLAKRLTPSVIASPEGRGNLTTLALDLPVKIAMAHSLRFSDQIKAIQMLEEIMLNCNILVVYLEQYRDLENPSAGSGQVETEFFVEQIKSILTVRGKILRLQFSWKKFSQQYKNQQNA